MSDTDATSGNTATTPAAAPETNGRARAVPPAPPAADQAKSENGRGSFLLGLLICGLAGALAYIGADLATNGGLSRKLAGAGRWDDDEDTPGQP